MVVLGYTCRDCRVSVTRQEAIDKLRRVWLTVAYGDFTAHRRVMWGLAIRAFNAGNYGMAYNWAGML